MIEYKEIDENGFVVETYVLGEDEIPPFNYIKGWGGEKSFFYAKWDAFKNEWVEDSTQTAPLDEFKKAKETELNKSCSEAILAGFECEVSDIVYHFAYDQEAQLNFQDTYLLFENNMVDTIMWSAQKNNEKVRLSLGKVLFTKVYLTGVKHKNNCLSYYHDTLLPLLQSTTTIEETKAVSWQVENIDNQLLVLDENNTIEKKLQSVDATQTEVGAQKEYNVYLESTVLELADMLLLSSLM
jgi:hypothetical protein